MSKHVFSAFASLFVAACASGEYEPWLTRGITPEEPEIRDEFTLERTACYGFCPVYKVTVDDRDLQQFQGKKFVAEIGGTVGKRLPKGAYEQLKAIAAAHEFDQFDTTYPNEDATNCSLMATDMPSVIVGFSRDGETRQVGVYGGCMGFDGRERFDAMIAAMDAVLDIDDLVGPREAFYGADE